MTKRRKTELKTLLENRRRELTSEMHGRIRDVRSRSGTDRKVSDELDAESDIQGDIDLALIQLRAETLSRVEAALRRLEAGVYGDCVECEGEISRERLTALPFAVRCTACEQRRENSTARIREQPQRRAYPNGSHDMTD